MVYEAKGAVVFIGLLRHKFILKYEACFHDIFLSNLSPGILWLF